MRRFCKIRLPAIKKEQEVYHPLALFMGCGVVAHLIQRSLPATEIRSSNPVNSIFRYWRDKNKRKIDRKWPVFMYTNLPSRQSWEKPESRRVQRRWAGHQWWRHLFVWIRTQWPGNRFEGTSTGRHQERFPLPSGRGPTPGSGWSLVGEAANAIRWLLRSPETQTSKLGDVYIGKRPKGIMVLWPETTGILITLSPNFWCVCQHWVFFLQYTY